MPQMVTAPNAGIPVAARKRPIADECDKALDRCMDKALDDAEFEESKHPRKGGKFTKKGEGGGAEPKPKKQTYSEIHKEKPQKERKHTLAGGEIAEINKAHYKGGQFLPSTEKPKSEAEKKLRALKTGRETSEPGKWELPQTPLQRRIHGRMRTTD